MFKKVTINNTWIWLQVITILWIFGGCRGLSEHKHFIPPEDSNLALEFDYPKEWEWIYKSESSSIRVYDPAYPPVTINSNNEFPRSGLIRLSVINNSNPESMNELISWYVDATQAIGGELVDDKLIDVDGVSARWLTRRIPERRELGQDFEILGNIVFFFTQGKTYEISISVPYDDRDSDFMKGFEYMISSIRFIP